MVPSSALDRYLPCQKSGVSILEVPDSIKSIIINSIFTIIIDCKVELLIGPIGACNIFTTGVLGTGGDDLGGGFDGGLNNRFGTKRTLCSRHDPSSGLDSSMRTLLGNNIMLCCKTALSLDWLEWAVMTHSA